MLLFNIALHQPASISRVLDCKKGRGVSGTRGFVQLVQPHLTLVPSNSLLAGSAERGDEKNRLFCIILHCIAFNTLSHSISPHALQRRPLWEHGSLYITLYYSPSRRGPCEALDTRGTSVQRPNMVASLLKANLSHIVGQQAFLIKTSNTMSDNFLLCSAIKIITVYNFQSFSTLKVVIQSGLLVLITSSIKGLAPFTYTVKLWRSWDYWPS